MYLVCSEIFPKFYQFHGRCCGPDKLLIWTTLEVAVQYVAEMVTYSILNYGSHSFKVLSIFSSKLCTMNLIIPWYYIYVAICMHKNLILDLSCSLFKYSWSFHLLENNGLLFNQNTKNSLLILSNIVPTRKKFPLNVLPIGLLVIHNDGQIFAKTFPLKIY
jgi:hypothetical protein